jgi:signal peptidase II
VTLVVVILDQITKLKVKGIKIPFLNLNLEGMTLGSSKDVLGNFFKITFIENPGMAFGIEIGGKLTLTIFTLLATFLIMYFIFKNRNEGTYLRMSLAFILGGAVGNLIDRMFYGVVYGYAPLFFGKVVDFLHFNIPDFHIFGKSFYSWPIFNVADISVTIGFIMILVGYGKIFKKKSIPQEYENAQTEIINPIESCTQTTSTESTNGLIENNELPS